MKFGLVGYSGSGKSTVFQWLTGRRKPDPSKIQVGQSGNAKVPDPRLDWLSKKFNPKKTTPAAIDFLDTPGLLPTERRDNPRASQSCRRGQRAHRRAERLQRARSGRSAPAASARS